MTDCTTMDCGNATTEYLCRQCVSDLSQWIEKAWLLIPELDVTIARLDVVRKAGQEGGAGGKAGSRAPMNLDAWQIKANLSAIDRDANVYARDQYAAGIASTIQDWVTKAELLISGPEDEHVDHVAIRAKVKDVAPPMTTRKLLPWLRENARISITSMDVRNWARRGHLHPVSRDPEPTYHPHEVIAAWHRKEIA